MLDIEDEVKSLQTAPQFLSSFVENWKVLTRDEIKKYRNYGIRHHRHFLERYFSLSECDSNMIQNLSVSFQIVVKWMYFPSYLTDRGLYVFL